MIVQGGAENCDAGCPDRFALYVMVASLNVIRCLMGSQCNSRELQWHQPKTAVQHVLGICVLLRGAATVGGTG